MKFARITDSIDKSNRRIRLPVLKGERSNKRQYTCGKTGLLEHALICNLFVVTDRNTRYFKIIAADESRKSLIDLKNFTLFLASISISMVTDGFALFFFSLLPTRKSRYLRKSSSVCTSGKKRLKNHHVEIRL